MATIGATDEEPSLATRALRTTVEAHILRGVSHKDALAQFGRIWQSNCGSLDTSTDDFRLSEPVAELSDFISHDWATPRMPKFAALCLHYNGHGALVLWVTMVTTAYLSPRGAWAHTPTGDNAIWFILELHVLLFAHLVLLTNWHHVRNLVFARRHVFIDKACINQRDEDMKSAGILGLAAFIKHSKNLVLCWTTRRIKNKVSRTFTRLWCTYECAAWTHLSKALDNLQVVPVDRAILGFQSYILSYVVAMRYAFEQDFMDLVLGGSFREQAWCWLCLRASPKQWIGETLVAGFAAAMVMRMLRLLHSLGRAQSQLADFSVQRADCFCCSVGHVRPDSRKPMQCDRELIDAALRDWYANCGHSTSGLSPGSFHRAQGSHMDYFNQEVRVLLSRKMAFVDVRHAVPYSLLMTSLVPIWSVCCVGYRKNLPDWRPMVYVAVSSVVPVTLPMFFYLVVAVGSRLVDHDGRCVRRFLCYFLISVIAIEIARILIILKRWLAEHDVAWPLLIPVVVLEVVAMCFVQQARRTTKDTE